MRTHEDASHRLTHRSYSHRDGPTGLTHAGSTPSICPGTYQDPGITYHPPPCQWPGPCFFFREGGGISKGDDVSSFEGGGSIDTRTGGPLTRILVQKLKKIPCARILQLVPSLQTWWGPMLCTSCIFVVALELTLSTFCNLFMLVHNCLWLQHFSCGAHHLFPMPFLLHTYKHTIANTKKTRNCNF